MERVQKTQELGTLTPTYVFLGMALLASFAIWLTGCTTYPIVRPDLEEVALLAPPEEIPESLLLDARIQVFNPGKLPSSKNASRGLTKDTRKAEAPYMAVELKGAMQQTGYWGRVRVVPAGNSNDAVNNFWADDAGQASGLPARAT